MLVQLNGFTVNKWSPVREIHQAIRATPRQDRPHLLGYTSVARGNPYQALLYSSFPTFGIAPAPILRGHDFRHIPQFASLVRSFGLHIHWLSWVVGHVEDRSRAETLVNGLLGRLDSFKSAGGKLVFTVHNVYPHDARYVDLELDLQQGVADRADAVHLMTPTAVEATAGLLNVDESKIVVAPHPNYRSAYENYMSRTEARSLLGLSHDDIVFVFFGALKGYKGLRELVEAFRALKRIEPGRPYKLIVAGAPDGHPELNDLVDELVVEPDVLLFARKVPPSHVQVFLNAADAGVLPYTRSLNSGAALLYLSFGLPVLATDTPVLRHALPSGYTVFTPNPADTEVVELVEGLQRLADLSSQCSRQEVIDSVAHLDPRSVSQEFVKSLRVPMGWGG